jgi:hypothetical protein
MSARMVESLLFCARGPSQPARRRGGARSLPGATCLLVDGLLGNADGVDDLRCTARLFAPTAAGRRGAARACGQKAVQRFFYDLEC